MWDNDLRNGFGKHVTSDGHVYEGYFKDNKKHGRGELTAADGTVEYDGTWEEDEKVPTELKG